MALAVARATAMRRAVALSQTRAVPAAVAHGRRAFAAGPSASTTSRDNASLALYAASVIVVFLGGSYGAVPLYKLFCQATGFGGTPKTTHGSRSTGGGGGGGGGGGSVAGAPPPPPTKVVGARPLRVTFNADVSDRLPWSFRPQQREVRIVPGETALVFYTAKNLSDRDVVGIAAYNVTPNKVGQYFNKIQCFCFEYQRLAAGEEVDMPAFFYIDPEFAEDPLMQDVDTITLSYTFFEAAKDSSKPTPAVAA